MFDSVKDPLRELLKRELEAFATETSAADSKLSSDRITTLAGLGKLIETRDSLQPNPRNWWPPLVLLGTLVIVSVLLFARVRETEIELDASLAQLSFVLPNAQVLTTAADLSELGVSGLRDVQLPQSQSALTSATVSFTAGTEGQQRASVTLSPLILPADAEVRLSCSEVPKQYRLSTNAAKLDLQAAAFGAVTISLPGAPSRAFNFPTPKAILMRGSSEDLNLDLTFAALPRSALAPQLEVKNIGLMRIDQFLEPNQTLIKRLSTILSGTLSFESLNGQTFQLRSGEQLQFEHSIGEIRSLEMAANHLDLKFYGRVSGMTAGTGEGHRSIMPTYLEWLEARHGLSLLWGSSLYLFGLAAAALRWFGVRM